MSSKITHSANTLFEQIKEIDENGREFWGARKLSKILDYSEYRHFLPVLEKAKEACKKSGKSLADHFEDYLEEITHGKGAKKTYPSVKLSYFACYHIVQCTDSGKECVKAGIEYFNTMGNKPQIIDKQGEANLIFYTTPQGNTRIDLAYDGETFWISQKKMAELFDVEVNTINYHLTQIFETKELNQYSVIRKIRITASERKKLPNNLLSSII